MAVTDSIVLYIDYNVCLNIRQIQYIQSHLRMHASLTFKLGCWADDSDVFKTERWCYVLLKGRFGGRKIDRKSKIKMSGRCGRSPVWKRRWIMGEMVTECWWWVGIVRSATQFLEITLQCQRTDVNTPTDRMTSVTRCTHGDIISCSPVTNVVLFYWADPGLKSIICLCRQAAVFPFHTAKLYADCRNDKHMFIQSFCIQHWYKVLPVFSILSGLEFCECYTLLYLEFTTLFCNSTW